ncbi:hypothetical protein H4R34_003989 [Dimargaris verticillata]|uniref:Uncharacterized protein n=1 Tax=Dimargaris verticillata TaxID=2761393 RepID=A0A9W8B6G3_9FUNG|nr:hypothetical protein H4R34_003989 [Dimargaris verticillata]
MLFLKRAQAAFQAKGRPSSKDPDKEDPLPKAKPSWLSRIQTTLRRSSNPPMAAQPRRTEPSTFATTRQRLQSLFRSKPAAGRASHRHSYYGQSSRSGIPQFPTVTRIGDLGSGLIERPEDRPLSSRVQVVDPRGLGMKAEDKGSACPVRDSHSPVPVTISNAHKRYSLPIAPPPVAKLKPLVHVPERQRLERSSSYKPTVSTNPTRPGNVAVGRSQSMAQRTRWTSTQSPRASVHSRYSSDIVIKPTGPSVFDALNSTRLGSIRPRESLQRKQPHVPPKSKAAPPKSPEPVRRHQSARTSQGSVTRSGSAQRSRAQRSHSTCTSARSKALSSHPSVSNTTATMTTQSTGSSQSLFYHHKNLIRSMNAQAMPATPSTAGDHYNIVAWVESARQQLIELPPLPLESDGELASESSQGDSTDSNSSTPLNLLNVTTSTRSLGSAQSHRHESNNCIVTKPRPVRPLSFFDRGAIRENVLVAGSLAHDSVLPSPLHPPSDDDVPLIFLSQNQQPQPVAPRATNFSCVTDQTAGLCNTLHDGRGDLSESVHHLARPGTDQSETTAVRPIQVSGYAATLTRARTLPRTGLQPTGHTRFTRLASSVPALPASSWRHSCIGTMAMPFEPPKRPDTPDRRPKSFYDPSYYAAKYAYFHGNFN